MNEEEHSLYIAAIKSLSLVDEVHKSVAVLYLKGCNFNCKFCHNSGLIPFPEKGSNKTDLDAILQRLEENMLIDGVVFTGGEPTLQAELLYFAKEISDRYEVVCVDSNGTNPKMLEKLSPFMYRIAMDIKTVLEKYETVANSKVDLGKIERSIDFLCERSKNIGRVEFRTTFTPPLVTTDDLIGIGYMLKEHGFSDKYNSKFVIQQYVSSDGVRKNYKNAFKTVPFDELEIIGKNIKDIGVPVAIRSIEKGYLEL
ncbi:MAG: radical SAM protein [Promethearchaeota archaeon]